MTVSVTRIVYNRSTIKDQKGLAMKKHEQLNLFSQKLKHAFLVARDSPRQAFYRIWIERNVGEVRIVKESGIKGRVLDRRCWPAESLDAAIELFHRRIKAKTNPDRKSPRKYQLVHNN